MWNADGPVEWAPLLELTSAETGPARLDAVLRLTLALAWVMVAVTVVTIVVFQGPLRGVVTIPARIVAGVGS